ncbi:MAG: methylmalonyl-CoA mutase, partial [Bacteroidia bacterium]
GNLHQSKEELTKTSIKKLQQAAIQNDNMFAEMMEAAKHCSLGQITDALFEVGGQYRRNM